MLTKTAIINVTKLTSICYIIVSAYFNKILNDSDKTFLKRFYGTELTYNYKVLFLNYKHYTVFKIHIEKFIEFIKLKKIK